MASLAKVLKFPSAIRFEALTKTAKIPKYMSDGAAGADVYADVSVVLEANERALISTGLRIQLPRGYEAQVRSRSGLAWEKGIHVLNAPGTIDSDYRGEVKVMLINSSTSVKEIKQGDRIAQLVIAKVERLAFYMGEIIDDTERSSGGFGSTGT